MRKIILKTVFLIIICCTVSSFSEQAVSDDHMIDATLQKDTYVFGNPIHVTITYKNKGTGGWKVRKPDDSLSTKVCFERFSSLDDRGCYCMGEIKTVPGPDGQTMAFIMPEPQYIVIGPGKEYSLVSDMSHVVFPGRWFAWAEDIIEKLRSEKVGFQIIFTKESADILLGIAKDAGEDSYKRSQHTKYLRELKTDMPNFRWPNWRDTPEEKKQKEALIQKNLKEFEEFWNKEKNSPDTEKALKRINKVCRELTESPSQKNCPDILKFRR